MTNQESAAARAAGDQAPPTSTEGDRATARPTVTIITPSYNQGRFLAAAIDSILAQDYPAIEHLVLDAASTDETLDVLRGYGDRVRWSSEPDHGQGDAIEKGFARTGGQVIAWLNADDVYLPGAVSAAVAALEAQPGLAGVYGNAEFIDAAGAVMGPCTQVEPYDPARLVNQLDYIVQPATFFRRATYEAAGGLDPGLRYCLDYDLWIRMGTLAPFRLLERTLAQVRIHAQTKTASGGLGRLLEIERMIARHGRGSLPLGFQREALDAALDGLPGAVRAGRWGEVSQRVSLAARYGARIAGRRLRRLVRRPA